MIHGHYGDNHRFDEPDADHDRHARRNGKAPSRHAAEAVVRRLADVQSEALEWLWPARLPLGKLSLICGDPGLGKSFITLDLSARVSRGALWPDAADVDNPAGSVVLFSAEDDIADTIKPRLEAHDADVSKIVAIQGIATTDPESGEKRTRGFNLATDLPRLVKVLDDLPDARLVVIDPISAFCGDTDSHKNTDVRSMLAPLAELAASRKLAVVCVTHLSKGAGGKAVYRATGSPAFAAAARAVWMVARDHDDKARRLLLPVKMNLAEEATGLAYSIRHGRVAWEPTPVEMTADDFLKAEQNRERENSDRGQERQKARLWLENLLRDGPLLSRDIERQAKECGFTGAMIRRAKEAAQVRAVRFEYDGPWYWALPGDDRKPRSQGAHQDAQAPVTSPSERLGRLGRFPEENEPFSDADLPRRAPAESQHLGTDDPAAGPF